MHATRLTAAATLLLLANAASSVHAQCDPATMFTQSVDLATGDGPYELDAGDVNGDGIPDIVSINAITNDLGVFLGIGDGAFAPVSFYAAGAQAFDVSLGDIDNDGDLDALIADITNDAIGILTNDGSGAFSIGASLPITGESPTHLKLIDINNDGELDIVANAAVGNFINVFVGAGDGTFAAAAAYPVGSSSQLAAYGDVNNDGHIDIATPNTGSDNLSLLLNNGDGTFAPQISIPSDDGPVGVAFGDLDSDGNLDLVESINGTMKQRVRYGAGDGTFPTSVDYSVTEVPGDNLLADLDNDGDLDIITVFFSGTSQVATLINDGAGNFSGPFFFDAGAGTAAILARDLNNDFAIDLVTSNVFGDSVSLLINQCGPFLSITSQPQSVVATAFGPAEQMTVNAPLADTYQWYFNDAPLTDNARFTGTTTDTLTINPDLNTEGTYRVEVSNTAGTILSQNAVMAVINTCPGDQNFDGNLSPADFSAWVSNYNAGCD